MIRDEIEEKTKKKDKKNFTIKITMTKLHTINK